jgi:uncharacterized protein (UPF0276 family)
MLLAINYSRPAAALYTQGNIQIDRFKCPDWPDMIQEASRLCPVAVHSNLRAGRGNLDEINWDRILPLLEATHTPYLNLHLEMRNTDFPELPPEKINFPSVDSIIERAINDIKIATQHFDKEKVILENVPYRGIDDKTLKLSVEPWVIRQVLDETGCGLLLDISHARISSHHLGMEERRYISELPVERVRELHFTGVHNSNGILQDHLEPSEADWTLLEWALDNISGGTWPRPWLLAFEYGGVGEKFALRSDPRAIAEHAPRLYAMVKDL